MASINDIVNVTVSTLTSQVTEEGFGLPLIVDYHTRFAERVRFYSDLQGMLTDGFLVTDGAYMAAAAAFAQSPSPAQIAVGRRALAPTISVELTPTARNSTKYAVKVNGLEASFTSDASATVAEICTGLDAAIDALGIAGLTSTDGTTKVTISAAVGQFFTVEVLDLSLIAAQQVHSDPGIATDMAAIKLENDSWYSVTLTTQSKAEIDALAGWVESNKKLLIQGSQDADILTSSTTDIASELETDNRFRTVLFFHPNPAQQIGAAVAGNVLPLEPGKVTFAMRSLAGVSATALTPTQIANLKAKKANYFTSFSGLARTQSGITSGGEWADVIRDRDWYQSRLEVLVFSVLANSNKVPFTDAGIAQIEAQVRKATQEAVEAGFLSAEGIVYSIPKAANVSSVDKAARHLRNVRVSAKLAGAIQLVDIVATITV